MPAASTNSVGFIYVELLIVELFNCCLSQNLQNASKPLACYGKPANRRLSGGDTVV